jgi:hypothetical protein
MRKSPIGLAVMGALWLMVPRAALCQVAQAQVNAPISISFSTGALVLQVSLVVPSTGSYLLNTSYYLVVSGQVAEIDAVAQVVGGGLTSSVAPSTTEIRSEGAVAATDVTPTPMVPGSRVFVTFRSLTIQPNSGLSHNQSALKAWLTPVQ